MFRPAVDNFSQVDAASSVGAGRLTVKLTAENVTKRVREIPENFGALKNVVKAQMCNGKNQQLDHLIKTETYCIQYIDDTGDVINVSDDEDLHTAYDVAENLLGKQLKLQIKPRVGMADTSSSFIQIDSKQIQKQESQQIEEIKPKSFIEDAQQEPQISASFVQAAIQNAVQKEGQSEDDEEMSSNSDESDKEEKHCKGKKKGKRGGKKDMGGLPRKAFKRLIKKELDKQCQQIFNNLMNCPEVGQGQEGSEINSSSQVVHERVECDGCGKAPIVGARYKCSVCKNFDFCSNCEERRKHDHPFLKIHKPEQAPKCILTVIDENMPNAQADIEQNVDENPTFFRNQGHHGHHGHHGHRGGHGGRGGRWGGRGGHGFPFNQGCHGPKNFEDIGKMAGAFLQNFMGGQGQHAQGGQGWRCGGGNSEWKKNRALIVTVPPMVHSCCPGETVMVEVIIKNNTHWPWKQGFTLQSEHSGADPNPLEKLVLPIDFFVDKMSTFNMLIPLKVKCGANEDNIERVARFNFINLKGTAFGETIEIKYKVVKPIDEVEFYQIAMDLFENQKTSATFDKIVEVLKKNHGDKAKTIDQLNNEAMDEEENQMYI